MAPRTVIITGAANGIGKATAQRCLKAGWHVIACDKDKAGLDALQKKYKGRVTAIRVDVAKHAEVVKCFDAIKKQKLKPDSLVNNAGILLGNSLAEYTPEMIDRVLDVNVKGVIYFSQLFGKLLMSKKQKGVIVNIASVAAHTGSADPVYGASKAAVLAFTKSCAMQFAPYIRVNAVAPTIVSTDLAKAIPAWRVAEYRKIEIIKTPLGPEAVADSVWFLLGDESSHYTGATLDINNGAYLG